MRRFVGESPIIPSKRSINDWPVIEVAEDRPQTPQVRVTPSDPRMTCWVRGTHFSLASACVIDARSAGAALGPVTTGHSQVEYTGPTGTGGMKMGAP